MLSFIEMKKYHLPITEDVRRVIENPEKNQDKDLAIRDAIFRLREQCKKYGQKATAVLELLDFAGWALLNEKGFLSFEENAQKRISQYSMALSHIETSEKTLVEILGVYA